MKYVKSPTQVKFSEASEARMKKLLENTSFEKVQFVRLAVDLLLETIAATGAKLQAKPDGSGLEIVAPKAMPRGRTLKGQTAGAGEERKAG